MDRCDTTQKARLRIASSLMRDRFQRHARNNLGESCALHPRLSVLLEIVAARRMLSEATRLHESRLAQPEDHTPGMRPQID